MAAVQRGVGNMKCPKCKTDNLVEKKVKNSALTLDRCNACEGMWFDKGELAVVLRKKAVAKIDVPKISLLNEECRCPKCEQGMVEFCYPGTTTFIDMCQQCQGIWLDAKEWTEISSARSEKNKVICPNCKTKQEKALSCSSCGVVFSKLGKPKSDETKTANFNAANATETHGEKQRKLDVQAESYADDIPGLKGTLLRFIDRSISSLTNY